MERRDILLTDASTCVLVLISQLQLHQPLSVEPTLPLATKQNYASGIVNNIATMCLQCIYSVILV
jgi:hypothetical protein